MRPSSSSHQIPRWRRALSPTYVFYRLREKGPAWLLRRSAEIALNRPVTRPLYRALVLFGWLLPRIGRLFVPVQPRDKRLLVIWDLRCSAYSVGDWVNMHEVTLCLRESHGFAKIDFCFLCDPQQPASDIHAQVLGITSDNFHRYVAELVALTQLNPFLGNVMVFDSSNHLDRYIADNRDRYSIIWPPAHHYLTRTSAYGWNFDFVQDFFREHGHVPRNPVRPQLLAWARYFLHLHAAGSIPVVVHVRNTRNIDRDLSRDSDIEVWLKFFDHCADRFPVRFIVICSKSEVDDRLRQRCNIVLAKDHDTSISQDLALIPAAAMFVGTTSGPAQMAMFSDTPYIITNYKNGPETLEPARDLPFALPLQRLIWKPATSSQLIELFTEVFSKIDRETWLREFEEQTPREDPLAARGCQLK